MKKVRYYYSINQRLWAVITILTGFILTGLSASFLPPALLRITDSSSFSCRICRLRHRNRSS